MSQIKLPLHVVEDAQGPCGIMDATGKAVAWFSETFIPTNGYVWKAERTHTARPNGGTTCYSERNHVIESILNHLTNQL